MMAGEPCLDTNLGYVRAHANTHLAVSPEVLSLLFSWFCVATASLFLTSAGTSEFRLRTLCLGGITVAAFILHLLARRAYKDPFHPDILLTTGHLVQFVLFSMILASDIFDRFLFPRTRDVRTHFPEMIFAVLLAQTCFNTLFCILPAQRHRAVIREPGRISTFIVVLAVLIWGARFFIVSTGSYLYIGSSSFKFESTAFSPLAIFDTVGRIVTAYAALRLFLGERGSRRRLCLAYILAETLWTLFSGSREPLFMVFVCVMASYVLVRGTMPWKALLVFGVVVVLLGAYLQFYRDAMTNQGRRENISIEHAARTALEEQTKVTFSYVLCTVFDRINDGQFAAGCIKHAGEQGVCLDGDTYMYLMWIPIPRFLVPSRPQFIVEYFGLFEPHITWSSAPVTTIGEAYLNFRWLGIVVAFFVLGIVYRGMDVVFERSLTVTEAAILIFYSTLVLRMAVNPLVSHISWMTKVLLLLIVAACLGRIQTDRARRRRNCKLEGQVGFVLP